MRIAIVDDNIEDQEHLMTMLTEYCAVREITSEILCFSSGDELLRSFTPGTFQCVFLDIYMDGTDGMETARRLCKLDPACRLIFATVSISHAVASYEVKAAWYLTKPFSRDRLTAAMDAACENFLHNSKTISVHVGGNPLNIRLADIFYMDCQNRQARLHLREKRLLVDENVIYLLGRLSADERFLMCNRNTLVNMDHVELAEDHDFRMQNGECVPIRQRGRAALKKTYLSWSLKELRKVERV